MLPPGASAMLHMHMHCSPLPRRKHCSNKLRLQARRLKNLTYLQALVHVAIGYRSVAQDTCIPGRIEWTMNPNPNPKIKEVYVMLRYTRHSSGREE